MFWGLILVDPVSHPRPTARSPVVYGRRSIPANPRSSSRASRTSCISRSSSKAYVIIGLCLWTSSKLLLQNDPQPLACYPVNAIQECNVEKMSRGRYGDWIRHLIITLEPERSSSKKPRSKSSSSGTPQSLRTRGKVLEFRNCAEGGAPTVYDWYDRLQACMAETESSNASGLTPVLEGDRPESVYNPSTSHHSAKNTSSGHHSAKNTSSGHHSISGHKSRSGRLSAQHSGSSSGGDASRPSSNNQSRALSPITVPEYVSSARVHVAEHIDAVSSVHDTTRKMPPPESILDRAFTLNYLPDSEISDYEPEPGQKNSIARIEALMRNSTSQPTSTRPSFINFPDPIPSPTQRAIDFISARPSEQTNRRAPRPKSTFMPIMGKSLAAPGSDEERRRSVISVSSSQTKRTNISDFAAQLASTSSLMLVHARNSSCGSRASLEDADSLWSEQREDPRSYLSARPAVRAGYY